jgi:outer membrane protein assembly complex protein YaeT
MPDVRTNTDTAPRSGRKIGRLLAFLGGALLILLAALLLFLHTSPARQFVLARVSQLLQQQNLEFNTDELRYNLLDLSLRLRNVRIRSQEAPDLPPFATIDRISLDLSLLQLLRRRYVLQGGSAEGVSIHYVVDNTGRDNLPRPPKDPEQPSQPLNYLIEELGVTNARMRYENRREGIDFALPVKTMTVAGNALTNRHAVGFEAAGGTITLQHRRAALDRLDGELDLGSDDMRIERLDMTGEGARLALSGMIGQFEDPQADLNVRGTVDAARASAVAGLKERVGGTFEVVATAKGRIAAPALQGHITGNNVSFRDLSDLRIETTAGYDMTAQRATFADLDLRAPWGQAGGNGTIALGDEGQSQVNLTVSGLDAAATMRAFDLPYVVASRVDARVQAQWPGLEYLKATGKASASLTPTASRLSRSVIPIGGKIDATGGAGAVDAVLTRVTAAGAEVSGRIRIVDAQRLDGLLQMRAGDVSRVVSAAESFLGRPAGALLPTRIAGGVQATMRLAGTVAAPHVAADVTAPALAIGSATNLSLTTTVDYSRALVTVRRLDVEWRQARAHASGTVELTGARRVNFSVDANAIELPELLRAVELTQVPASGTVSLQGRVVGTTTRPAATFTLTGQDLSAYNEVWGTLSAGVNMTGRQIVVVNLVLDKPQRDGNGRIVGGGTYDLDRRAYTVDLRSSNLQLVSLTLPNGRQVRGPLQLMARGAGTVEEPAGTIDVVADGLRVDQYDIGRFVANAVVANRQATITANAPTYGLNATAAIGTAHPFPATVKARIDSLQLAALPFKLQTPLDGQLRATVDAAGDLAAPEKARASAAILAFDGVWNGQPFRVDVPALLRYADERLAIDQLRVVAQDSTLAVSGDLPLTERGAPGALKVDARANLATLTRYAPAGTNITGSGEVTVAGVVRGTLKAIDPELTVIVANGTLITPEIAPGLSDLNVRARIANGEANVEQLNANWGVARISAAGRIPLEAMPALPVEMPRRGGPATFTASVQGLDVSQIPGMPAGLGGRVSLDAQLSATRADLRALEGRVTFPELQLTFNGLTLDQQQVSTIALAGGVARVEQFTLTGSVGTITATGTVGLAGERPINVDTTGNLNIAALSLFTDVVRAEGETTLQIAARGSLAAPELNGFVNLADATFVVDEPTIAAENVTARLDLAGRRMSVARLTGDVNGGTLTGSGFVELGTGGIADAALELAIDDVAFDAPLDLRSLSDATVRLAKRGDAFVVEGQVTIDEAGLTGDINFDEGLLAAMNARRRLDLTEERNAFLERVRFNLDVDTASPIIVNNNLARAEVTADLRLIGTPYEPALSGRLTVLEEGEITLNERRYEVERGVITFIGERRILPSFDLLLNTSARNYDITIAVTGEPGDTETTLTSDPPLPEPDIMAVLVTGRTLEEMRGEEFEIAREQVLSYLAGRVGSQLGRGLQRATGLSTVRIEPNLIANEADPSARLTVGQEITDDLELIYSTNLTDSNDQIWIAEYDVTRRFQTTATRQADNSYRFDIRHDVRIGGSPAPRRTPRQRPTVAALNITSDGAVSEAELRQLFDVTTGEDYDFFAARNRIEDIEETLEDRGHLQSRVRLQRTTDATSVTLNLRVTAGPRVTLIFEGTTPPDRIVDEVRTQWRRGVFDTQRIDDSVEAIRAWLMEDQYLQPKVEGSIEEVSAAERRVTFRIVPGTRFATVVLAFEGASGIAADELDDIIREQDLEQQLFTDSIQVTELLERYYREQGYLVAEIAEPRYEFEGNRARVVLAVREGPRFIVRNITTSRNVVVPTPALLARLPFAAGDPFLLFAGENALDEIRDVYWSRGYNDVRSDYDLVLDRAAGRVDVTFTIDEGLQSLVTDIVVEGNDETSNRLVREQLQLTPEAPLDLAALARSRRNLYQTGAFSVVDIRREELPAIDGHKPVQLNVAVREVQPIQLRYGVSYDTERGLGGIFDVSAHNMLGKARVIGLRSRYDGEVREARGYISQPSLRYWPIATTGSIYWREERNPETEMTGRFDISRRGASIQQEREFSDSYVWTYGFRYERARSLDPAPSGVLDETLTVTPLTSTITRETRDEVLDATRGSFSSQAFAYSPSWLGSDQAFVKYFGQYFHYIPLQPERRERFTNEILRPRLVYAGGIRLGLSRGIGGLVPVSERFFAGGSTTLRGLAQNAAGPIGFDGLPTGGAAMLVINNELRFPVVGIFDGVVFSDIGNVFPRLSDFDFSEIRKTAGVGVRVRTRWFLVRGDYGMVLDRRAGETRGRFYFSLGQAF